MATTIRVSDDFHAWIAARNAPRETMEETLRRLVLDRGAGGPSSRFGDEDAAGATATVAALRTRDATRLRAAREAV